MRNTQTNEQVERMNRTIKEEQVGASLQGPGRTEKTPVSFSHVLNLASQLKMFKSKSPYELAKTIWNKNSGIFIAAHTIIMWD